MKQLWEVWEYTKDGPKLVAVVRGRKEAVDKAKQLAPLAGKWFQTHKVYRADPMPARKTLIEVLSDE